MKLWRKPLGSKYPRRSYASAGTGGTTSATMPGGRSVNIMKINRSPVQLTRRVTFKWASYVNLESAANVSNSTWFISTRSIYDPNYQQTSTAFTNTQVPWYTELMGTLPSQYRKYKVEYIDFFMKLRNVTPDTAPMVTVGPTIIGTNDYPTTTFINNIAIRTAHMGKTLQWETGQDAYWVTFKFRLYPWQAMGITKSQYNDVDYITPYNATTGETPWLAISLGDSQVDGAGAEAQKVQGNLFMNYHCKLLDPGLSPTE